MHPNIPRFCRPAIGVIVSLTFLAATAPAALSQTDPSVTTPPPATEAPPTTPVAPPATEPPTTAAPVVTQPAVPVPDPAAPPATAPKPAARKAAKPKARTATKAPAFVPGGGTYLDIDISSQTMRVVKGGRLLRTVHVSTGSGKRFCAGGKCQTAHTPRGTFRVYGRHSGWHTSYLGRLYNPLYFKGGYAIHGSGSVPSYPASHGCVRVTISTASWLSSVVPNGTRVSVHD